MQGIRSSIALFITSLLAAHLFLHTGWKKLVLILAAFPISMFKNAVRIVTLSLLAARVDQRIVTSSLHEEGGIPFFLLALAMLAPILLMLRRSEKEAGDCTEASTEVPRHLGARRRFAVGNSTLPHGAQGAKKLSEDFTK